MADRVNTQGERIGGAQQDRLQLDRQGMGAQLQDPKLMSDFNKRINQETGHQGERARQMFTESAMNRANSRFEGDLGKAITGSRGDKSVAPSQRYYPSGQSSPSNLRQSGAGNEALINQALAGSNRSEFATGNASGKVGVGQPTAQAGGERFGTEKPDMAYAAAARQGAPLSNALSNIANLPNNISGGMIPPFAPPPPPAGQPPGGSPSRPPGVPSQGGGAYSPPQIPMPQQRPPGAPPPMPPPPGGGTGAAPRPPSGPQQGPGSPLPYQTAPQRFQPPAGQQPIPGTGTYAPPMGPPPRPQGAPPGASPGGMPPPQAPQGSMPPQGGQSRMDQQWANRPQFDYGGGQGRPQGAGAPNAPPPGQAPQPQPQAAQQPPQPPGLEQRIQEQGQRALQENFPGSQQGQQMMQGMPGQRPGSVPPTSPQTAAQASGPPGGMQTMEQRGPVQGNQQPRPQVGQAQGQMQPMQQGPQPGGPGGAGAPRAVPGGQQGQGMSAPQMVQQVRQSNPNVRHEQLLQHLNANQHQLDPQSRQQLQGINRAFQREKYGLKPDQQRGQQGFNDIPSGNFNMDRSRMQPAPAPQQAAPVRGSERQAAGQAPQGQGTDKSTAKVAGRTSQGQQVRVGDRARNPQTGEVMEFTGKGWEPVQGGGQRGQGGQGRGQSGGRGRQGKQKNPFGDMLKNAAKAMKGGGGGSKAPRLHVTPLKPVKRFHARATRG
jgi:hypothetical protein